MIQKHVRGDTMLASRGYVWHDTPRRCSNDYCGKLFHLLHRSGRCMIWMRPTKVTSLPPDEDQRDTVADLQDFGLLPRTISLLGDAGYLLVDQLLELPPEEITAIPHLGEGAVRQVAETLQRYRERRDRQEEAARPSQPRRRLEQYCRHCSRVTTVDIDRLPTCTIFSCHQCGGTMEVDCEVELGV